MDKKVRDLYADGYFNRVFSVLKNLRTQFFGLSYELGSTKTLKRDKSHKSLLRTFFLYKKHVAGREHILEQVDLYLFLKEVLETEGLLSAEHEEYLFGSLGIKRNFSGLSKRQENIVKLQSAGAAFWLFKKNRTGLLEEVAEELLAENNPLYPLFAGPRYPMYKELLFTPRVARGHLAKIFALPKKAGRPPEENKIFIDGPVLIPRVFLEHDAGVNFHKLRWVVTWTTVSLYALGCSLQEIKNSELITFHKAPLRDIFSPICEFLINDWILEAFPKSAELGAPKSTPVLGNFI